MSASIILTKWRTRLKRKMNERDIVSLCTALKTKMDDRNFAKVTRGIHTDCLLNYETVKYFGGEQHEGERYREAIREYQMLEYKVTSSCSYCIHFLLLLKLLFSFFELFESSPKFHHREQVYLFHHAYEVQNRALLLDSWIPYWIPNGCI